MSDKDRDLPPPSGLMGPPGLMGAAIPAVRLPAAEQSVLLEAQAAIDDTVAPLASEHDAVGRYPTRSIAPLKESGLLTLAVPAEFGGVGSGHRATLEAQLRIAVADSAAAQIFKVHDELVREIFVYCPDALRPALAGRIVGQRHIIGLAVAETGKRVDDPWNSLVMPTPDGGFVINGKKIYTTGAAEADEIAVWAFNPTVPGIDTNPLLGFQLTLAPRDATGVIVHRDWAALGQRATDSGAVTFDSVVCSTDRRASEPGRAPLPQNAVRYQAGLRRSSSASASASARSRRRFRSQLDQSTVAVSRRDQRRRRPDGQALVRRTRRRTRQCIPRDNGHGRVARRLRPRRNHPHRTRHPDLRCEGLGLACLHARDVGDLRTDGYQSRKSIRRVRPLLAQCEDTVVARSTRLETRGDRPSCNHWLGSSSRYL